MGFFPSSRGGDWVVFPAGFLIAPLIGGVWAGGPQLFQRRCFRHIGVNGGGKNRDGGRTQPKGEPTGMGEEQGGAGGTGGKIPFNGGGRAGPNFLTVSGPRPKKNPGPTGEWAHAGHSKKRRNKTQGGAPKIKKKKKRYFLNQIRSAAGNPTQRFPAPPGPRAIFSSRLGRFYGWGE